MADVTVPFGLPYPEATDLVRDGAADIEALAEGVNNQLALGFVYVGTRYYTSSGTFVKADPFGDSSFDGAKMRAIRVRMVGGGGGSGGASTTTAGSVNAGGGGGGAAYAESFLTDIAGLPTTVTVTRGDGGAGGAAGSNAGSAGGTSSFDALVTAVGGAGGTGGVSAAAPVPSAGSGNGGARASSTGQLTVSGLKSAPCIIFVGVGSRNAGGGSVLSPGTASGTDGASPGFDGVAGVVFGGGAASGFNTQSQATARAGAAGGAGIVIVDVFA